MFQFLKLFSFGIYFALIFASFNIGTRTQFDCAILLPRPQIQDEVGVTVTDHIPTPVLKMNIEHISETLVANSTLTRLRARKVFIAQTGSFHHLQTLAEIYRWRTK
jgi:hypothetical protein